MRARNIQIIGYERRNQQIQTHLSPSEWKSKRLRYLQSGIFEIERIAVSKFVKSYERTLTNLIGNE